MEEAFRVFKTFLALVAQAETQFDQCRDLISHYPGAKAELFKTLDQRKKGYITPQDICQFYVEKNSKFSKVIDSIVEKYFRFNEGVLTLQEFSQILRSKSSSGMPSEIDQNPFGIFYRMIEVAIESYLDIEKVRVRLCDKLQIFESYFRQNYHVKSLTKSALKVFMRQHDHYDRDKFECVCSYIFGDISDQISWDNLFKKNQYCENGQQNQVQGQQLKKIEQHNKQTEEQSKNEILIEKKLQKQEQRKVKSKTQPNQLNQLFSEIDNIEKALKEKKKGKMKSNSIKDLSPLSKYSKNKRSIEKNNDEIKLTKQQEKEEVIFHKQEINRIEEELHNIKYRCSPYLIPKFKDYRDFFSKYQHCSSQYKKRPKYTYSVNGSRSALQKSSSQGQLQIKNMQSSAKNLIYSKKFQSTPYNHQKHRSSKYNYTSFIKKHSSGRNPYSSYCSGHEQHVTFGKDFRNNDLFSRMSLY